MNGLEHGIYYQQKEIHHQFYSFVFHNDLLMAIFSMIHPRCNVLKRARLILFNVELMIQKSGHWHKHLSEN